jgi:hypothetical protein
MRSQRNRRSVNYAKIGVLIIAVAKAIAIIIMAYNQ